MPELNPKQSANVTCFKHYVDETGIIRHCTQHFEHWGPCHEDSTEETMQKVARGRTPNHG